MNRVKICLLIWATLFLASCGTTNSANMYDPNTPVTPISISTFGNVDPSSKTIALPSGEDPLLEAFKTAFSDDGWATSTSTTNTRYVMQLETRQWTYEQRLAYISLTIVDERSGAKILSGERKTYSPNDPAIDVKAVADMVISSLKSITKPTGGS